MTKIAIAIALLFGQSGIRGRENFRIGIPQNGIAIPFLC